MMLPWYTHTQGDITNKLVKSKIHGETKKKLCENFSEDKLKIYRTKFQFRTKTPQTPNMRWLLQLLKLFLLFCSLSSKTRNSFSYQFL